MFNKLLDIVNFLISGIQSGSKVKQIVDKKKLAIEMLNVYFTFLDICEDGEKLLNSVETNIKEQLKMVSLDELATLLKLWDEILKRQSLRLYKVQQYVSSNSYIAVFNPESQKKIEKAIGYKTDQVVTLHGIGSSLFIRSVLPIKESPNEIALVVQEFLTMKRKGAINKNSIKKSLLGLRQGLDTFREILEKVLSPEEIVKYSKVARDMTNISQV